MTVLENVLAYTIHPVCGDVNPKMEKCSVFCFREDQAPRPIVAEADSKPASVVGERGSSMLAVLSADPATWPHRSGRKNSSDRKLGAYPLGLGWEIGRIENRIRQNCILSNNKLGLRGGRTEWTFRSATTCAWHRLR
jgi:hypothetical protein